MVRSSGTHWTDKSKKVKENSLQCAMTTKIERQKKDQLSIVCCDPGIKQ